MHVRQWVVLSLIVISIGGCNGHVVMGVKLDDTGLSELRTCPFVPDRETMVPPPGVYTNHRITIDYDRLVPRPDPRVVGHLSF